MGIKKGKEYFLNKFKEVHNNYYQYPDFEYKNNNDKINIICPKHGSFEQIISNHASGKGCNQCAREKVGKARRLTLETMLEQFVKKHGTTYNYDQIVEYKGISAKYQIFCNKHQEDFFQDGASHRNCLLYTSPSPRDRG